MVLEPGSAGGTEPMGASTVRRPRRLRAVVLLVVLVAGYALAGIGAREYLLLNKQIRVLEAQLEVADPQARLWRGYTTAAAKFPELAKATVSYGMLYQSPDETEIAAYKTRDDGTAAMELRSRISGQAGLLSRLLAAPHEPRQASIATNACRWLVLNEAALYAQEVGSDMGRRGNWAGANGAFEVRNRLWQILSSLQGEILGQ